MSIEQVRPTKKQRELLEFIETFIAEHGYSPSYREIMVGLNYTSVATVALHVNSLIKRGHLLRRDGKARSLEVARPSTPIAVSEAPSETHQEQWLVSKIEHLFKQHETAQDFAQTTIEQLRSLIDTLETFGLGQEAQRFAPRLATIEEQATDEVSEREEVAV
jgi:repressor LexA